MIRRIVLILRLNCREAAALLSDRSERPLALHERLALRMHLLICGACRRYRRYLESLHQSLGGDAPAVEGPDATGESLSADEKLRIRHALKKD